MKKPIRAVALILLLCIMLVGVAFAGDRYTKEIIANYVGVRLVVDGVMVTPKDAKGNTVEPFIADGTTYLPVRALAEALGKEVEWDGTTKTVYIGEKPEEDPTNTPGPSDTPENEVPGKAHSIVPITYSFLRINGKLYEIVYSAEDSRREYNVIYQDMNDPSSLYLDSQKGKDMWTNAVAYAVLTHSYQTTATNNPYLEGAIDLYATNYTGKTIQIEKQQRYLSALTSYYTYQHTYDRKVLYIPKEAETNGSDTVMEMSGITYCGKYFRVQDYCRYFSLGAVLEVAYDETLDQNILVVEY